MYAKSFIAHASRGRLTSAAIVKTYHYDRYVCHLCKSALVFHPEWGTHRPWFEHTADTLTENGREHCPYVTVVLDELNLIQRLRRLVKDTHPVVRKAGNVLVVVATTIENATASVAVRVLTVRKWRCHQR
jgi:hypothetical protein